MPKNYSTIDGHEIQSRISWARIKFDIGAFMVTIGWFARLAERRQAIFLVFRSAVLFVRRLCMKLSIEN